jgi:hypothetical protein
MSRQAGVYGGWWGGMGDSGEVASEGSGLPTDSSFLDTSSGEFDPSIFYPAPGYNIETQPGEYQSPEQFAAEQTAARSWLASIGSPVVLNAAQIAAGLAQGILKVATPAQKATCPGGMVFQNGDCAHVQQSATVGTQLVPGVSNNTLLIVGLGFAFLMLLSSSGGRRR